MEKDKWIDDILDSTRGIKRAEAGPFFFEKLAHRLESSKTDITQDNPGMRWALRFGMASLIAINVLCIANYFSKEKMHNRETIYTELSKELGYTSSYSY